MPPPKIEESAFSADVVEFIRLLQRIRVRCLVVRGEAVIFHGYPRLTGGIDFFYERTRANARGLFHALDVFWDNDIPGVNAPGELLEPGVIIQSDRPPNRIDLHNQISGVSFATAWDSRVTLRLQTTSGLRRLHYIGIGPLRRNKRATARPRDLDDLEHLVPEREKSKKMAKRKRRWKSKK
jgi:hypothetical protein